LVTLSFIEEELLEVLWVNLIEGKRQKEECPLKELNIRPEVEIFDLEEAVNSLARKKSLHCLEKTKSSL
jgi:hypothetical protein